MSCLALSGLVRPTCASQVLSKNPESEDLNRMFPGRDDDAAEYIHRHADPVAVAAAVDRANHKPASKHSFDGAKYVAGTTLRPRLHIRLPSAYELKHAPRYFSK